MVLDFRPRFRIWVTLGLLCYVASVAGARQAPSRQPSVQLAVAGRVNANPALAARGAFVAAAWGATKGGGTDVYMAVSRDSGVTFAPPVRVTRQADARINAERPPVVALAPAGGAPSGEPDVAVLWTGGKTATTITVTRSTDGGRTFQRPIDLQASGAPGSRGWASMAADDRGQLHVVWLDHRESSGAASAGAHVHAPAITAPAAQPKAAAAPRDGVAMAQKSGLYYARVGAAAEAERVLAKGVCYCCKTTVAAGPGNRVVAAWRHVYPGNLRDIAAVASTDGGRTFGGTVRVSEDGWSIDGCPENGPSAAVDADGMTHMAWPTVVGGTEPVGAIFYSTSRDGRAFAPRVRVPTLAGRDPEHVQLAISPGGHAVVAWDEVVNGRRSVVVRRLESVAGGTRVGPPSAISGQGPARHPALAVTPRGVLVAWTDGTADAATRIAVKAIPAE